MFNEFMKLVTPSSIGTFGDLLKLNEISSLGGPDLKKLVSVTTVFCFTLALFLNYEFLNIQQHNIVFGQEENSSNSTITIPTTISKEAQYALINITSHMPEFVTLGPNDLKGWEELNKQVFVMSIAQSQSIVDNFGANITSTKLGDVNVLDIKPKDWMENDKILIYVHGGGYTILGANSTLTSSVPMANVSGLRVISVD